MKFILSLALCLVVLPASFSEEIRSNQYGFTLKLSDQWKVIPPDELQNLNNTPGQPVKFDHGIRHKNPLNFLTQIMVRTIPDRMERYSFDDLEKSLEKSMNLKTLQKGIDEKNLNDVISNIQVGQLHMDRQKKRFVFEMDMKVAGMVNLRCLGYGMISKDGVTCLYCYSSKAGFEKMLPSFQQVADSFAFDANRQYVEPAGFFGLFQGGGAMSGGVIGAIIGLGVALVVYVIKTFGGSGSSQTSGTA
jgi:hypothetical protein